MSDIEIIAVTGNPTPQEREAIREALQKMTEEPKLYVSEWTMMGRARNARVPLRDAKGALGPQAWRLTTRG